MMHSTRFKHRAAFSNVCVSSRVQTLQVPRLQATAQEQSTDGLIFSTGAQGAWDEGAVSNPIVRVYQGDDEQRWFMWYTARGQQATDADAVFPAAGSIGVAVSSDGVRWTRGADVVEGSRAADDVGMMFGPNPDDWWTLDTRAVSVSDVQMFSSGAVNGGVGVYWMFYTGTDFAAVDVPEGLPGAPAGASLEGLCARPGLAMSQDGRNWARIEAEHHTHALFDRGEDDEWDSLFAAGPQVIAAGPRDMRLFYHSYDARERQYRVGLATSPDGFKWQKQGPVFSGGRPGEFDSRGAGARCVVRDIDSRKFFMFYEAFDDEGRRSIGLAVSDEGLAAWERHPEPVLRPAAEAGAWDSGEVGAPCAVSMAGGKWRLYYAGKGTAGPGAWSGVGLALSEGETFKGAPVRFRRRVE